MKKYYLRVLVTDEAFIEVEAEDINQACLIAEKKVYEVDNDVHTENWTSVEEYSNDRG
mgnify:CR=1|tara:strand:+ start:489 stop:662 length:174 start_codon:yes stop_codon:yes gene_type:complete